MKKLKEKSINLINQIDKTVDLLVKQNMDNGMNELVVVIDQMANTMEALFVNREKLMNTGIEIDEQHIINLLKQVVEAIDNTDFVLVADLLNYEIKETFEEVIRKI